MVIKKIPIVRVKGSNNFEAVFKYFEDKYGMSSTGFFVCYGEILGSLPNDEMKKRFCTYVSDCMKICMIYAKECPDQVKVTHGVPETDNEGDYFG